jgi:hypothetical protein
MGALKQNMAEIHESTLLVGVHNTAIIFNTTQDHVKDSTMAWDGYQDSWESYVHHVQQEYGVVIEA